MLQSIFIAGLGGQGIVTLADILCEHASEKGLRVSLFNAKGMAQRGGRVTSEIRLSDAAAFAFGARISPGGADVLVGMEIGEAVNSLSFLKPDGVAVLLDYASVPAETVLKKPAYPTFAQLRELFSRRAGDIVAVENAAAPHNVFLLGVLVAVLPRLRPELSLFLRHDVVQTMTRKLKRGLEENLRTFHRGCEYGGSLLPRS